MRVVVVSAWPPWPLTDGARLVLHHHLRHLTPRHEVTVLSPAPPIGPVAYLRRRALGLARLEPADAVRVRTPALLADLATALDDHAPDVVHLHGWGTAALASAVRGVPCVHVAIDSWSQGLREHRALPRWRAAIEAAEPRLVRRHERRWYPRMAAVAVVTEREAAAVRDAAPGANVVVVPNGVDLGDPPPRRQDDPVLGFHGNLASVTNATAARVLVHEVLPTVRAHRPAARATVIGPGAPPDLAGAAAGEVPDVRDALTDVAVYVAPMWRGTGMKNKVLEAMAAGLPVVATPLAVEGIGAGPGVTVATSVAALADAVVGLLDDPDRRAREGAAARERAATFTWDASARLVEALWEAAAR